MRWKKAENLFGLSNLDASFMIEFKQIYCKLAALRFANNSKTIPLKVIVPSLNSWME